MPELKDARQERFAREYVIDYNGKQAATRAGYSEKCAQQQSSRLLSYAKVLARVRELQAEQVERMSISADRIMAELMDTYNRCRQAEPVMVWDSEQGKKVESGQYTFDSKGALRALELIGKHLGMYMDKVDVTAKIDTGKLDNVIEQLRGE